MSDPIPGVKAGQLSTDQKEALKGCEGGISRGTLAAFETAAEYLLAWGFAPPSSGQRALAEATLRRIADAQKAKGLPSCAAVALVVVGPFHVVMGEVAAGQIGAHYQDDVPDLLAAPPSDENLHRLSEGETTFWHSSRGSWFGALVTTDSRFNLLKEARRRDFPDWQRRLAAAQEKAKEPAQDSAQPTAPSEGGAKPTMTQGSGEQAESGGVLGGIEKAAKTAGDLVNIVKAVADIRSQAGGSYSINGLQVGQDFSTLPDEDIDDGFPARNTKYTVVMNASYHISGTLPDPSHKIALDTDLTVLMELGFAYQWGLRRSTGTYPCLHVRNFRLTQVKMSHPWFTDLNAKCVITNIAPSKDHPVAGIRLALDLQVIPAAWIVWRYKGTCGGLLEFHGDGEIKAEIADCQERPSQMGADYSPPTDEQLRRAGERIARAGRGPSTRGLADLLQAGKETDRDRLLKE